MAPRPNAKRKFSCNNSEKVLALSCKWQGCDASFALHLEEYQTFAGHVLEHCKEVLNVVSVYENESESADSFITFKCGWNECSWEISSNKDQFVRHVMFHAYHSRLKCLGAFEIILENVNQCNLDTDTQDMLPDTSEPFECKWESCGMTFICPDKFYRHVEMHGYNANREGVMVAQGEEGAVYSLPDSNEIIKGITVQKLMQSVCRWQGCSFLAKSAVKIKDHCRTHTGERQLACPKCGAFFSNKTKYIDHLTRQNTKLYENFQCSHCLKRCASERLLRDHMRHHVNHVKCPHCDMTCANPSSLRSHIKFRHSMHRPYKCAMCDYSCKTSNDLKRHEETHFQRRFQCETDGCNFVAKTIAGLRSHLKLVHKEQSKDKFMCHICERRFSRGYFLTKHLKSDHNFSWPSGHSRFRYKQYEDGFHRLQMVRFESAELTEQLTEENRDLPVTDADLANGENRILVSSTVENNSILGISPSENANASSDAGMENLMVICSDLNSLYETQTDELSLQNSSLIPHFSTTEEIGLSKEYVGMLPYYASGDAVPASNDVDDASRRSNDDGLQFIENSGGSETTQIVEAGVLNFDPQACEVVNQNIPSSCSDGSIENQNAEKEKFNVVSERENEYLARGIQENVVLENMQDLQVNSFVKLDEVVSRTFYKANSSEKLKDEKASKITPKRKCKSLYSKETIIANNKLRSNETQPTDKVESGQFKYGQISHKCKRKLPFSIVDSDVEQCQSHVTTKEDVNGIDVFEERACHTRSMSTTFSERPDKRRCGATNSNNDIGFNGLADNGEVENYEQVILDISKTLLSLQNSEISDVLI